MKVFFYALTILKERALECMGNRLVVRPLKRFNDSVNDYLGKKESWMLAKEGDHRRTEETTGGG